MLAAALAGLLVGTALAGWLVYRFALGKASPPRVTRFAIDVPDGRSIIPSFNPQVVFSRDSRSLLFSAVSNVPRAPNITYRRRLEDLETSLLVKGLSTPVFSPDNQWLILLDPPGRLVKFPLGGGAPVPLVNEFKFYSRGDWGPDVITTGPTRIRRASFARRCGAAKTSRW